LAKKLTKKLAKQNKNAKTVARVKSKTKPKSSSTSETGKFIGNARGFGFVVPSNGAGGSESELLAHASRGADIFIPPHSTLGALDGDIVTCKITQDESPSLPPDPNKPSRTGKVTEIISRRPMVGAFFTQGNEGFVRPVETKIPYVFSVPPKTISRFGLADGHRVIFSVDKRMDPSSGIEPCFITEVMGHINDPGIDVLTLVRQADIPYAFSQAVMDEVAALPDTVTEEECKGRLDLRGALTFTIDGDDTKDIDDAISFAVNEDGTMSLGVHIADVSHYVKEFSALDDSALDRGTSIYLADRVIPMLPHKLSSGICSLFPNVDRLTLSCLMTVSPQGHVVDYKIAKTVIHSKKRWTYNQVQKILDGEDTTEEWRTIIGEMDNLRAILRQKREAKGALDFDLPEAKIRVDETGKPISIEPYARTHATGMIEEFMILCNETIAAHFLALETPFVYRTHEAPSIDKLAKLSSITQHLGFTVPKNADSPIALQRLLEKTADTPAAQAVATAVLHSLPQARYTSDNPTHYGLASQAYCHFTSPIRRYADLQIHRIIKAWLSSEPLDHFNEILPTVCAQCSHTERAAEALEREVEQLKKVQFMSTQEGQTFEATVSGVTQWGVYVVLHNTVEGLIPFESLRNKGFAFDKEKTVYVRKQSKKSKGKEAETLRHGEPITVRLVHALEDERKLIFAM